MAQVKLREVEQATPGQAIIFVDDHSGERKRRDVPVSVLDALKQDPVTQERQMPLDQAHLQVDGISSAYRVHAFFEGILRVNTPSGEFEEGDILVRDERMISVLVPGKPETLDFDCPPYTLGRGEKGEITISPDPPGISIKSGVLTY